MFFWKRITTFTHFLNNLPEIDTCSDWITPSPPSPWPAAPSGSLYLQLRDFRAALPWVSQIQRALLRGFNRPYETLVSATGILKNIRKQMVSTCHEIASVRRIVAKSVQTTPRISSKNQPSSRPLALYIQSNNYVCILYIYSVYIYIYIVYLYIVYICMYIYIYCIYIYICYIR